MLYMAAADFAECLLTKYLLEHVVHALGMIHSAVLHVVSATAGSKCREFVVNFIRKFQIEFFVNFTYIST